jgi:mRNA interferase RelE/StbE
MKSYRVEIVPAVRKQIKRLPKADKGRILDVIESLAKDPRPHGYKKLVGYSKFFRYRVGNYRIIYQIDDDVLLVSVLEVADRRDAY